MFSRKFSSNMRRKKRMIMSTIILLVVFLSVGYSAFTTNLGISGTLNVSKYDRTLYGVLKKAANVGIYAKEYTGSHQDTMAGVGSEKIYYWYGPDGIDETPILNMNNVIFANHCWQMIRTTDTGGVKIIYNGEPENGQCLNTRDSHAGYSYINTQYLNTSYYYGTNYIYDKTNKLFSLTGTVTTGTIQVGQYTCLSTSQTGTCSTLYLVHKLVNDSYWSKQYDVMIITPDSNYAQFGKMYFNQDAYYSPSSVGYMYNKVYSISSKDRLTEDMLSPLGLKTTYYFADSYDYNVTNASKYTLTNPYKVSSENDYSSLVGKYTFGNTSSTYSYKDIYYIAAVDGTWAYYIKLSDGNNLAYYNSTYTYGDSYTDSGIGAYTINNPTTITRSDYYSHYRNMTDKYICINGWGPNPNACTNILHTNSNPHYLRFEYVQSDNTYKFASSFTYDSGSGTYTLNNDNVTFWDVVDSNNITSLATHHYTCWNTTGECNTISYISDSASGSLHYINLTDGKDVETALNEMLLGNDVNQNDSTIKKAIDAWYKNYMTDYTSQLEDTIFCNDRSINSLSGWDPDGGSVASTYLQFKNYNVNGDLSCTNTTDKFSMSNSNARLTYPVGLLTSSEAYLLNKSTLRKTGYDYWLASPQHVHLYVPNVYTINTSGDFKGAISNTNGVRPVVSLKPGTEYVSGTGSMEDPYVIE